MMNRPDWIHDARRSVPYFGGARRDHPAVGNLLASMFVDDIQLGKLRVRRREEEFDVRLDPHDAASEREIVNLLGEFDTGWRGTLKTAFTKFVDDAILHLVYAGETWYELVRPSRSNEQNGPRGTLEILPPGRVVRFARWTFQMIPPTLWQDVGKRIVVLPRRDTWRLAIPPELGGPRGYRRLLELLAEASEPAPEFSLEDMQRGRATRGYDFMRYHKDRELTAASLTRRWGWPGRGAWTEYSLEYFTMYRHLRFARSKAALTDHVISELNKLLKSEGFACRVVVIGIDPPAIFDNLLKRLWEGKATFKEVVETIYH